MKLCFKLLAFVATAFFVAATVIKFTQNVTYKEAVGIMEEFCKEMMAKCPLRRQEEKAAGESASQEA